MGEWTLIKELNKSDTIKILARVIPLGILFSSFFILLINFLSRINIATDEIDSSDIVFHCIILLCLSIIPTLLGNIFSTSRRIIRKQDIDVLEAFSVRILQSLTLISILFFFFLRSKEGLSLIGLGIETPGGIPNIFLTSAIVFVYFNGILGLCKKIINKSAPKLRQSYTHLDEIMLLFSPKLRILALLILFLAVISEEILYRGYIVLFLGTRSEQIINFGLISIILTVFGHLYQGKDKIVYHTLIAVMFVSLTIITKSILISITIHLFNNLFTVFALWKNLEIEGRFIGAPT